MKNKFIFATDVDGTMLMDDGTVHPETLAAFKKAKEEGHIVVIATGRAVVRTSSLMDKMPYVNYFICNNGAVVYDVDNKENLILHGVNPKHYEPIHDFALEHKIPFKMHTEKSWIGYKENEDEHPTPLTKLLDQKIRKHIKENPKDKKLFNGETITQLSIFSTPDFCAKHLKEFEKKYSKDSSIFLTNSKYIDVNPKKRSKWEGLIDLAKKLKIPTKNIVTFGDSGNDYEMIYKAKDNGYAMANSHADLRAKIEPRIGSNNSNAIGSKILEYLEKVSK